MNKKIFIIIGVMLVVVSFIFIKNKNNQIDNSDIPYFGPQGDLSKVKVVTVYESVIDDFRDINSIANILAETKTEYIHRGFFRYSPEVENYELLKNNIALIKSKNPNVIFGASLIVSQVDANERDPLSGESIPESKIVEMAFDPQKWGINYEHEGKLVTKEDLHKIYSERSGLDVYLPDITNADYQKLVLDIIKKEIDSGADAIWIDGFYLQADLIADATGDVAHPAVKATFEAYSKIVDEIHAYGASKGKYIYVGSWGEAGRNPQTIEMNYPFPMPKLDFVTVGISHKEMTDKKPDKEYWGWKTKYVRKNFGNAPIIAVIDWSFDTNTALGIFSQELSKDEAKEALRSFDAFFNENGILFAYPVHGGWMGWKATKGSFGKTRIYDSIAPEFETYDTIKELVSRKASK